jgi:hypothetical protein
MAICLLCAPVLAGRHFARTDATILQRLAVLGYRSRLVHAQIRDSTRLVEEIVKVVA